AGMSVEPAEQAKEAEEEDAKIPVAASSESEEPAEQVEPTASPDISLVPVARPPEPLEVTAPQPESTDVQPALVAAPVPVVRDERPGEHREEEGKTDPDKPTSDAETITTLVDELADKATTLKEVWKE